MNILALDASGIAGSVAYIKAGKLVGEYYICDKLTHSQTIMPMLEHMKQLLEINLDEIDAIAVTSGPGSFTGLRIGVTAAKSLALALDVPIIGVPTLDTLAYAIRETEALICPLMDARRHQVYTALYEWKEGELIKLIEDSALDIEALFDKVKAFDREVVFLGDGVQVYKELIKTTFKEKALLAPSFLNMQRASVLADISIKLFKEGKVEDPSLFTPIYLRKSQAEREKEEREKNAHS